MLPYPVFLLFLSPFVSSSVVSSFSQVAFRPPPGFPPLPLHLVFDPLPLLVLLCFTLTLLSLFLPPVVFFGSSSCLSLLFGSLPYLYFLIFFLFSCGFRFLFSFVGPCLVFLIACALVLSLGGVVLHTCLSAICSPLFSVPLMISPLAFLPFLRSSYGYLFCPFSYGVFSFSTSSFGGFGLLHSPAYSSPSGFLVPPFSLPPVSRFGGGCIRGVLHRYYLGLL